MKFRTLRLIGIIGGLRPQDLGVGSWDLVATSARCSTGAWGIFPKSQLPTPRSHELAGVFQQEFAPGWIDALMVQVQSQSLEWTGLLDTSAGVAPAAAWTL